MDSTRLLEISTHNHRHFAQGAAIRQMRSPFFASPALPEPGKKLGTTLRKGPRRRMKVFYEDSDVPGTDVDVEA
jgi:hypothetical protein